MSHRIRFSLIAVLTLLAMFVVPQVSMAASLHSDVSVSAGVLQLSHNKPSDQQKDTDHQKEKDTDHQQKDTDHQKKEVDHQQKSSDQQDDSEHLKEWFSNQPSSVQQSSDYEKGSSPNSGSQD
jgi:hypothetical protein